MNIIDLEHKVHYHHKASDQQQMINKPYSKTQFLQIMYQLSQQDPLYYCQHQNLQMIYSKTIQHDDHFTGVQLMQFCEALKQRNIDKFNQQIKFYKQLIKLSKQKGQLSISSKQLLNTVYLNEQVGYLTSIAYEMTREQIVEIEKLQQMIEMIERNFVEQGRVCVPRRVEMRRSVVYIENSQDYKQQVEYELSPNPITQSKSAQQQILTLQFIQQLKSQVIDNLQQLVNINQDTFNNIQSQFNKLQYCVKVVNQQILLALREEVQALRQYNTKIEDQLRIVYDQLENKQDEIIAGKNVVLELTQQTRKVNKQLLNYKLMINEKDAVIYQLQKQLIRMQNAKSTLQNKTESFFNQYTNLKQQYENFVEQVKLQQERKTQAQQSNLLPTISLKQQLEDAQFKIKQLKFDKEQLLKDMENNENIFAVKLINLEKQLEQAKIDSKNKLSHITGMSRLSRNFEPFMHDRQQSIVRKSIYSYIIGTVLQQSRLPSLYSPQQQNLNSPKLVNKMSSYIEQVDNFQMLEKSKKKQQSKYKKNRFSYVENVIVNDDNSYDQNNNKINTFIKKPKKEITVVDKCNQQTFQLYQQQSSFTDKIEQQFYRQSKGQPKFNFTQVDFDNLKKMWKTQDPDVLQAELINEIDNQILGIDAANNSNINKPPSETIFITPTDIISKSGIRYQKHLVFNRIGVFIFDTKLRLQKSFNYKKIMKITFTYYNLDTFVISFKKNYSMKKKSNGNDNDLVFKCFRTRQLLEFLSQQVFRHSILRKSDVKIAIQKQSNIWVRNASDKDSVLTHCGNYYNPFRLGLSLKNQNNRLFFAELSRQNYFSFTYQITCVIEEFGVYCFELFEDQLQKERKFIYLMPLVKRMVFIRQVDGYMVKIVYEDWSAGKTFLLSFKSSKQALRFETMCKHQLKLNLTLLQDRKNKIQQLFQSNKEHQKHE